MPRPALDTLACSNPEYHHCRRLGETNLTVRIRDMAMTAFTSCAVAPVARKSLSDAGVLYSIPNSPRPLRRISSTIPMPAVVSELRLGS
jgi:hypothetical protein